MEITLTIPEYAGECLQFEWEDGFEIETKIIDGQMIISANSAGLISLAKQMLTLAQETVPPNRHFHYDDYSALEEGSAELVIERR